MFGGAHDHDPISCWKQKGAAAMRSARARTSMRLSRKWREQENVGAVLVMDGAMLVGILTERDYARNIVRRKGRTSPQTLVGQSRALSPAIPSRPAWP